ncbi:MAG TPA: hypothetical protein VI997_04835 [Candidatus Thermoplasmatota archaeon]|nr:hypothetical protein [Candidatus Thermoplasmatota archaeon]
MVLFVGVLVALTPAVVADGVLAPAPLDACRLQGDILVGVPVSGDLRTATNARTSRPFYTDGPDHVWMLHLAEASSLRFDVDAERYYSVYVRSDCEDGASEVAFARYGQALFELAAGPHYVVVDTWETDHAGPYALAVDAIASAPPEIVSLAPAGARFPTQQFWVQVRNWTSDGTVLVDGVPVRLVGAADALGYSAGVSFREPGGLPLGVHEVSVVTGLGTATRCCLEIVEPPDLAVELLEFWTERPLPTGAASRGDVVHARALVRNEGLVASSPGTVGLIGGWDYVAGATAILSQSGGAPLSAIAPGESVVVEVLRPFREDASPGDHAMYVVAGSPYERDASDNEADFAVAYLVGGYSCGWHRAEPGEGAVCPRAP